MKKNKISKNWLNKHKKDYFFNQSKIQGYRARSAYKLIEMNEKFKFFRKSSFLLDLGSCPGGWSQVAAKKIYNGKILAIDIKPMQPIRNVDFIQGDFQDEQVNLKIVSYFKGKADIVLSDMAANTTGNKSLDSYRTGDLCLNAMNLASRILTKDGVFLSKIFMGSVYNEINENAKKYFKTIVNFKPTSSKKESKEIYIYCKGILKI